MYCYLIFVKCCLCVLPASLFSGVLAVIKFTYTNFYLIELVLHVSNCSFRYMENFRRSHFYGDRKILKLSYFSHNFNFSFSVFILIRTFNVKNMIRHLKNFTDSFIYNRRSRVRVESKY